MIGNLKKNPFVWNSLILFSGTMLVNVLNYLFHLMVGRLVSAEIYGEIEALFSLLTIVSVPSMALGLIATKYGAKMKLTGDRVGSYAAFRYLNKKILIFGLPVLVGAFLVTPLVKNFLKFNSSIPLFLLWILMFFSFLGAVSSGMLSGWQKFGSVNAVGIWNSSIKLLLGLIFIWFGFAVNGAIGSFLLAGLIGYVVSLSHLRFLFNTKSSLSSFDSDVHEREMSEIRKSIFPIFTGTLAITFLGNVDLVFAKHALDPLNSGIYSALSIVAKTIFFITGVITSVLFAMTAGDDQNSAHSRRTFYQALFLTVFVGIGSVVFFEFFSEFSLGVFFGEKYLFASNFLSLFALMAVLYSLVNLLLQYLLSLHQAWAMPWFLAMAIFEVVILYFYGTDLYTVVVLAIISQTIAFVLGLFFVLRAFRARPSVSRI